MKADAFEDVQCPFNYKAELRKTRRVLDTKVGEYIHDNPKRSYRALSEEFNLSPGTLCGITRRYERRIKAAERRRDKRVGGWWSGSMRDTQIRRHPKWRFRAQPSKPK